MSCRDGTPTSQEPTWAVWVSLGSPVMAEATCEIALLQFVGLLLDCVITVRPLQSGNTEQELARR
jgi:hypothetical protein